jgi:hypothetical protein
VGCPPRLRLFVVITFACAGLRAGLFILTPNAEKRAVSNAAGKPALAQITLEIAMALPPYELTEFLPLFHFVPIRTELLRFMEI